MKKIAYIELDTHAEIASNFMELMQDSEEFSVDYYFSEKIIKNLGISEGDNIKKVTPENIIHHLSFITYDLVIIGTVHRYLNVFLKIVEKFNTAIIVHNLNFSKVSKQNLFKNVFKEDVFYRLKLLFKEELLYAPKLHQKAKNLLVLDESLRRQSVILKEAKRNEESFKFLPIFFTKYTEKPQNKIPKIVISGAVSQKRRDYKGVLEKLKSFKQKAEIVFLGKAAGEELQMLKNFEKEKPEHISIQYFTEKVPSKIFDEEMKSADVFWCPVQQETSFFSIKEIYGETKMSGNIGDAIKYGKPSIFPKNFNSDLPFVFVEENDVETQISKLSKLKFENENVFSKEKILEKLQSVMQSLF